MAAASALIVTDMVSTYDVEDGEDLARRPPSASRIAP
jgi:hypothetical protein